jgi:hypothetical protein
VKVSDHARLRIRERFGLDVAGFFKRLGPSEDAWREGNAEIRQARIEGELVKLIIVDGVLVSVGGSRLRVGLFEAAENRFR